MYKKGSNSEPITLNSELTPYSVAILADRG